MSVIQGLAAVAAGRAADRLAHQEAELVRTDSLLKRGIGGVLDASMVSLAREIAQDIFELEDILVRHGFEQGINDPGWADLQSRPEWGKVLQQQILEWNAADSTKKRIMLKSQAALEAALPGVFSLSVDPNEKALDRLKAVELLGKFGNVGADKEGGGGGGGGFSLKINLSSGQQVKLIDETGSVVQDSGGGAGGQSVSIVFEQHGRPLEVPAFLTGDPSPDDEGE
jgi:hypothetical protein